MGKLASSDRLRLYRIVPAAGYKHTGKASRLRELRARRLATAERRNNLKRMRELRWARKSAIASGLPLIQDAELEAQFMCDSPQDDE